MKNLLRTVASIAVLSATLSAAQAEEFNYNYVEGNYQDMDQNGVDSDAWGISGSFDIAPNLNLITAYSIGEIVTPDNVDDITVDTIEVGLGYHAPLNAKTDMTANLKAVYQDMDNAVGDDTGYAVGFGIRHQVNDTVEIGANISYQDIYDADDTTYELNSRFAVNKDVSLGLAVSTSENELDTVSASMRFNF